MCVWRKAVPREKELRAKLEAAEARAARLEVLLRKIRWYVEAYDTREHNRDQDKDLTEIDAALDVKEAG
jgi:hypothetical protein